MQADGVVLKGESDTWPGLEFAEARKLQLDLERTWKRGRC